MCLCKFDKKILTITQTGCLPRPIWAKTLNVSSDCICRDILKKTGEVLDQYEWLPGKHFQYILKMAVRNFSPSRGVHLHDVHNYCHTFLQMNMLLFMTQYMCVLCQFQTPRHIDWLSPELDQNLAFSRPCWINSSQIFCVAEFFPFQTPCYFAWQHIKAV